jgi:hypothetical protein
VPRLLFKKEANPPPPKSERCIALELVDQYRRSEDSRIRSRGLARSNARKLAMNRLRELGYSTECAFAVCYRALHEYHTGQVPRCVPNVRSAASLLEH